MKLASLEAIVAALNSESVRYVVAGVATLGYKPLVPIAAEQFANAELRGQWIRDKGMKVLNFFSDRHRETNIDLLVAERFDFDRQHANALQGELAPALPVRFVSLRALIAMKEQAGRPRDLDDVQHLRWILEEHRRNERS